MLHNIVPHSHKNVTSCAIESPQEKLDLFHALTHIFEADLGENHLKEFTHFSDESKEELNQVALLFENPQINLFKGFIGYSNSFKKSFYSPFPLSISKERGPPSLA